MNCVTPVTLYCRKKNDTKQTKTMDVTIQIYKAYNTLLNLLRNQGFNVSSYENISIHNIDSICEKGLLNMKVHRTLATKQQTLLVQFNMDVRKGRNQTQTIDAAIERYFENENTATLSKENQDILLMVFPEDPNKTLLTHISVLLERDNYFVISISINRLQYNVLEHKVSEKKAVFVYVCKLKLYIFAAGANA